MCGRRALRWLLAIWVIASLVVAPLSRPAMAGMPAAGSKTAASHASAAHAMTGHGAMAHHQMMTATSRDGLAMLDLLDQSSEAAAHEMPCCPSQAPMPADCDKCLYMTVCMVKYVTAMPSTIAQLSPVAISVVRLRNDAWPDGLGHPPPEHPPRSLV